MEHSQEYVRLRQLLLLVIGFIALLGVIRIVLPSSPSRDMSLSSSTSASVFASTPVKKKTYRAGKEPVGSFQPKLTRLNFTDFPISDMNDRGDYLALASQPTATYREYIHYFDGKSKRLARVTPDVRYFLSPNGSLIRRTAPAMLASSMQSRPFGTPVTNAYNEARFIRRFNDDGSVIRVNFLPEKHQNTYQLRKEKMGEEPLTYYTTPNPIIIMEKGEADEIWLREQNDTKSTDNDTLWRLNGNKKQAIGFPSGYHAVDRVVQTGSAVAATFGSIQGKEPFRAFVQSADDWRELPLPHGYTFSYVQKIMRDGLILGFVTDGDREHFKQVVWKGDSVTILDDLPAWPKNGQISYVVQATRKGDIYVRNVTDTTSGTSDYYLLSLKQ